MRPIDRILFVCGVLFVAVWFFALAGAGLGAWFSGDDMMNLHGAWTTPWGRLLAANAVFFGAGMRPLGTLWYRAVYAVAGFDPLPFHIAAFALLLINCWLAWSLARRLSGSGATAAVTTLLVSYNARAANLYFDTGAIYDVLCFLFYVAALEWYVRVRQLGVLLSAGQMAVFAALSVCALNAKEMAVTLPLAVVCYELLYHPPRLRVPGAVRRWLLDEGRGVILAAALVAVFSAGKSFGPDAIANAPGYRMTLTAERALTNAGLYMDHIFYRYDWFTPGRVMALWLGMLAVAALSRSRPLRYAWLFLSFSVAPLLFIDPRGGSALYVCLFGWALYGASLIEWVSAPLRRVMPERARATAVFLAVAAVVWPFHRFEGRFTAEAARSSGEHFRAAWQALKQEQPSFRPGGRILFLNDPIRENVYDLTFLVHLGYGDDTLTVDRVRMDPALRTRQAEYDYVLDYAEGRFQVVKRP